METLIRMRSRLQPVAGGEAAVGVAGAGVGGAGPVASHHRPRPPPGQAHQIHLGAALGKPLVGEGVAELVGVQAGQPGLPALRSSMRTRPHAVSRPRSPSHSQGR